MKSCFGMLIILLVLTAVIGTGGLLWYLSHTAEFTNKEAPATASPSPITPPSR